MCVSWIIYISTNIISYIILYVPYYKNKSNKYDIKIQIRVKKTLEIHLKDT